MGFQPANKLSPPPPRRRKGDSLLPYVRARRAGALAVAGFSNDDIADLLGCSVRTVRNYLKQPEIRQRMAQMIEEADRQIAQARIMSIVSGIPLQIGNLPPQEHAGQPERDRSAEILNPPPCGACRHKP